MDVDDSQGGDGHVSSVGDRNWPTAVAFGSRTMRSRSTVIAIRPCWRRRWGARGAVDVGQTRGVRGLRAIERDVLQQQRQATKAAAEPLLASASNSLLESASATSATPANPASPTVVTSSSAVVLEYCAAVRGFRIVAVPEGDTSRQRTSLASPSSEHAKSTLQTETPSTPRPPRNPRHQLNLTTDRGVVCSSTLRHAQ